MMHLARMQPARVARVGQSVPDTLASLAQIARELQTAGRSLNTAWTQLSALRQQFSSTPAARVGQLPPSDERRPLPEGTPFTCVHPYGCDLYNMFPDGGYGLVGRALSGVVVFAAPPTWRVPYQGQLIATNRMGNVILVRAETPVGPREGWTLAQYLRAYAAPVVPPRPPRIDPRGPVSERIFERQSSLRIPTEVIR